MSLKTNKLARANRSMLFGMMFLAVIVFGSVFAMLYMSFEKSEDCKNIPLYTISISPALTGDSVMIVVNDSTLFCGLVTPENASEDSCLTIPSAGEQNMISIVNFTKGVTLHDNLPPAPISFTIGQEEL